MKYIVQSSMLPKAEVCHEKKMYFRADSRVRQQGDILVFQENGTCDFSTYFNSFSLNKWLHYTKLSNLFLSLTVQGTFIVEIYSAYWYREKAIRECIGSYTVNALERETFEFPVDISRNDNVYFTLKAISPNAAFYESNYYTEILDTDLNPVNIDLVMCTFKREQYIKRNIDLIVNDFLGNDTFNGAEHFHIKVVDNGQTLDPKEIEVPGLVKLYPNLNVGGSGGFCRGMIESLHDDFASHILFMDDDVLVQVEAFEKTYTFLSLLKQEHQKDFLGGAMLRLDQKNRQHECLAGFAGNYLISEKQNLNLNLYKDVLFSEKPESVPHVYAAWWFCCIPKTVASLENLPYPFFIRMDDIEYSVRNIRNAISLNGIAVWHEAFDKKYSTLMENYFMFRNNLVVNMVHHTGDKKMALKFLFRRFAHDIFRYDYGGAELLLDGVENLLKGPEFYKTIDTVKDLKGHGSKQVKMQPIMSFADLNMSYGAFLNDLNRQLNESKLHKLIRWLTWNGHFLPDCFFKPFSFAEYGYSNRAQMFFCRKRVLACNPNFETAADLAIDKKRAYKLIARWFRLSRQLSANYTALEKEYRKEFRTMTSEPFWRKYLKLEP